MKTFVKYLGNAALNGISVAVYKDGDNYKLIAESIGGKRISGMRVLTMNAQEYEAFVDRVSDGIVGNSDAWIVDRALRIMKYDSEFDEEWDA
jgi:hypothetical protein